MGTESSTLAGGEAPAEAAAPPAAAEEEQQPEPAAAPALVALEEENQQPAEAAAPEPPLPEPVVAGASKGPAPVRKDPSKSAVVPPAPVLNAASLLGGPSSLPTSGLTPKLGEGLTDSPAAWDQMEARAGDPCCAVRPRGLTAGYPGPCLPAYVQQHAGGGQHACVCGGGAISALRVASRRRP